MFGYRVFYNAFDEIITNEGDLYRGVEQPGGTRVWIKIESGVDMMDYLRDKDDYYTLELEAEEIKNIVQ